MFASPMEGPLPAARVRRGPRRPRLALALVFGLGLVSFSHAQESGRPDQVLRIKPSTGKVSVVSGRVLSNTLTAVEIEHGDKTEKVESDQVTEITWGTFPPSFQDGATYAARGDWENSVAKYRVAATDASARLVVQAAARLEAAEALLRWGASDPNQFVECIAECDVFLSTYPDNRDLPRARWLKARASLLAGDAAGAAAQFRALYEEAAKEPPTTGYDREICLNAGLDAAWAYLLAGETGPAREIFVGVVGPFATMIERLDGGSGTERARLEGAKGVAAVGEGFCQLAGGQAAKAIATFQTFLGEEGLPGAARGAATLGMAEAHLAQGELREAQLWFARVSAVEYADRDRLARALVGLADTTLKLNDGDASSLARRYLEQVMDSYGDTPSARAAAEMQKSL